MDFSSILSLSADELYEQATKLKFSVQYNDYIMRLTHAANLGHVQAWKDLSNNYLKPLEYKYNNATDLKFYQATQNYAYSAGYIATLHFRGNNLERDLKKARELYLFAIAKGHKFIHCYFATMDCSNAQQLCKTAINNGDNNALVFLANFLSKKDKDQSIALLEQAIEKGVVEAMNWLAKILIFTDINKALHLLNTGIDNGSTFAMETMAILYQMGEHCKKDTNKALVLYEMAAERGLYRTCTRIGNMYYLGEGVVRDLNRAKHYYDLGVDKAKCTVAMLNLSQMYQSGQGVAQNNAKALELLDLSLKRGNVTAMVRMADWLVRGVIAPKNLNRAKQLYMSAHERKHELALTGLITLFQTTDLKNDKKEVIDYFIKIGSPEKLKMIYPYNEYEIDLIVKHAELTKKVEQLEEKNAELNAHIEASPEGELYLAARKDWEEKRGQKRKLE
jgi:TPR repeat protein